MKTTIPIDNHEFGVEFTNFGFERYFLDGQLIEKKWNLKLSGKREFEIGQNKVVIELCVKPGNYYCRLHLNDELHTEELFPEFKERVAKASDRGAPTWLKRTTITLILIATALTIFNELN